jgi:hypothetical protein
MRRHAEEISAPDQHFHTLFGCVARHGMEMTVVVQDPEAPDNLLSAGKETAAAVKP